MSYKWEDKSGDRLMIETQSSVMGYPALTVWESFLAAKPHHAAVYLPTDPDEVAKLVAAILNAAGCQLERLVFPEDALKGMHGMTVVKR